MKLILTLSFIYATVNLVYGGEPAAASNNSIDPSALIGLYNTSDKVTILTDTNFNETVLNQNRASLVEFYNSYCGHCKRFAPVYKELADDIFPWRDIILVTAIDCAEELNNGFCREYEVMAYPTLRYLGPGFVAKENNYGKTIDSQNPKIIKDRLASFVAQENHTDNTSKWPNFGNVTSENKIEDLFNKLPKETKLIIMVFEPENSTIGIQNILYFNRYTNVTIRRFVDFKIASKFKIDYHHFKLSTIDRDGNIVPYATRNDTIEAYVETIRGILNKGGFTEKPYEYVYRKNATALNLFIKTEQSEKILAEVLKNKHAVYQADLEMGIRGLLFSEIPRARNINGERLLALQRILAVLNRYNPLGRNGKKFIKQLNDFVLQSNQDLTGLVYEAKVKELEKQNFPIFSTSHFVGCAASQPNLRGFTCSLWQLFHFFTVQANRNEISNDPLEVLQAINAYVKFFFGCTDCSEHFQEMANRRKIWNTQTKDEAILWLWAAHNEVNQRLARDSTEDPKFPKIQFPSKDSCPDCYRETSSTTDIDWEVDAVLQFLKTIHDPENINRLSVENEEILFPTIDKIRQKRMISNVFSDMDMRMGMLLYGLCIVMMIAAFKLFVFKGYRKKPYSHDFLGKV